MAYSRLELPLSAQQRGKDAGNIPRLNDQGALHALSRDSTAHPPSFGRARLWVDNY